MEILPIRSEQDHQVALREVERLWGSLPNTPEGNRLDVLATLIDAYENETVKLASADPIDILRFAIADLGRTQAELATILGSRSRASEILAKKRRLSVDHIAKISAAWRLSADLLIQPYRLTKRTPAKRSRRKPMIAKRTSSRRAA